MWKTLFIYLFLKLVKFDNQNLNYITMTEQK